MPKKSLGQHWLKDKTMLSAIVDVAGLQSYDTVLEIGPGLGTLTSVLLRQVKKVIAVEYDNNLARKLPGQFPGKNLEVINDDILTFDLARLPKEYKIVANVPYYITQKIIEHVLRAENQPASMTLLVQREVAEKIAATPGDMTPVAIYTQRIYDVHLGPRVPKEYFIPPPLVDSQVIICNKRHMDNGVHNERNVMRVVRAGFSEPRKKLRSSLAGGLGMEKNIIEMYLEQCTINPDSRAAELSVADWEALTKVIYS